MKLTQVFTMAVLATFTMLPTFQVQADDYVKIVQVWECDIAAPREGDIPSPQIVTEMTGGANPDYLTQFQFNFRELPDFKAGGIQIQMIDTGSNEVLKHTSLGADKFQFPNARKLRWKQVMRVAVAADGTKIIQSGISEYTIDGDPNPLILGFFLSILVPDEYTGFQSYSTDYSVDNSGILFGRNRVKHLTLDEVRKYKTDGSVEIEWRDRVIYER